MEALEPFIHVHETSSAHRLSYVEWKELEIRLKTGNSIDTDMEKCIQAETEKWKCVLKCIVDVILHCARNNLPLRGSSNAIGNNNCGVFLSTLELISHYNPQLFQHIENIKSKKPFPSYFSPKIQNEVIEILGNKVRSEILINVRSAKYFSIIFDCTPDTAHLEQMSQIIRYVNIKDGECSVEESFVNFVISHQKTGRYLSEEIMQKLSKDGLDIRNCRGQGFDNGSNMAEKYEEMWSEVLVKLNCTNKSLQGKSATIDVTSSLLSGLAKSIQYLRDEGVQKYTDKAKNVCDSMSIKSIFSIKRLRKVKRMAGEMTQDESHLICAEKSFKLECFKVYDKLISEIETRSDIYHTISSDFNFLSEKTLNESSVSYLEKCAADLGSKYNRDIDTLEFINEVVTFKFQVKELVENINTASHLDILKVISKIMNNRFEATKNR
ncbi:unnamed protein product [Larinioides sclopetarius]|uniref:DUF4371 domain-containing protein n=1 Tax=Larinioides sclopetarius TaxID=280406 RepID=A0AAV1ZYV3_9ARAC